MENVTHRPSNEDCIIAMCCVEIGAEEDANGVIAFCGQVAEEFNEARLVFYLEIWTGSHYHLWLETNWSDEVVEFLR